MTRWPTVVEISVCSTLKTLFTTAAAIMPSTSRLSRPVRPCGIAVSRTARSRNGVVTETTAEAATSRPTTARRPAYGRNSVAMRRSSAGGGGSPLGRSGGVQSFRSGRKGSLHRRGWAGNQHTEPGS